MLLERTKHFSLTIQLLFSFFLTLTIKIYAIQPLQRSFNCPSQDFPSARISTRKSSIHQNRIIGGDPDDSLADYIALLAKKDENGSYTYCTAVKIAPTYLVCSAACASNPEYQYAFLNASSFFTPEGEINIKSKSWDPLFESGKVDERSFYDLAIVELESSSPGTSKYMRVSINASLPSQGTFVRLAGYGATNAEDGTGSDDLRQVDVPVYPEDECQEKYADESIALDFNKQVCGGYPDRKCGVCSGDFGGPMLQYDDDGEPVLVGINIFFGEVGCTGDFPTVAVRTAQYFSNFTDIGLREGIELAVTFNELPVPVSSSPTPLPPLPSTSSSLGPLMTPTSIPSASTFKPTPSSSGILPGSPSTSISVNTILIIAIAASIIITIPMIIIIVILVVRR